MAGQPTEQRPPAQLVDEPEPTGVNARFVTPMPTDCRRAALGQAGELEVRGAVTPR
jgi:hypothetical protein